MILIVVGTQKFQMNRLLKNIDDLKLEGKLKEDVFAQIGHSQYIPHYYEYVRFLAPHEFERKIGECHILITHSGVGTIMAGIRKHKPIIVYPRLSKYGEHVDNHQCEIAEAFSNKRYVIYCREEDSLFQKIQECDTFKFENYISHNQEVVNRINRFLEELKG